MSRLESENVRVTTPSLEESVGQLNGATGLMQGVPVCVIGGGFVGLVTSVGFAQFGHSVTAVECDRRKLAQLQKGVLPFFEADLGSLLSPHVTSKRIQFTDDLARAVKGVEAIFVTVGTPPGEDGRTDLAPLEELVDQLVPVVESGQMIVLKSTVPVGTGRRLQARFDQELPADRKVTVINNPEFLREGQAVYDFFHPQRIVIGGEDSEAVARVAHIYRMGMTQPVPIVTTNRETAEMIKYASNAFIALKVGFVNELAGLCDLTEINVLEVAHAMGMDPRIGDQYLVPGPGWGGSCLGKDLRELEGLARSLEQSPDILTAIRTANEQQHRRVVRKIEQLTGPLQNARIGILGLAFKAGTSDLRDSPAVVIARMLLSAGARLRAYDPQAHGEVRELLPELEVVETPYEVARDAVCLTILTEWNEFQSLDFRRLAERMRTPNVVDARNLLVPEVMRRHGFTYVGMGLQ